MKSCNLISLYYGQNALKSLSEHNIDKYKKLKEQETETLRSLCETMIMENLTISHFDGFYVGYRIEHISKEFDILRFGNRTLINIELKSELSEDIKHEKILKQLHQNYYYLKFINLELRLFSYVINDGFYEYNNETGSTEKVPSSTVANLITIDEIDKYIKIDEQFLTSNYLISPFGATDKFLSNQYFLTQAQQNIKKDITRVIKKMTLNFLYFS